MYSFLWAWQAKLICIQLCKLWVSSLSFQLVAEVNGPAKTDDSKSINVNSCVAFGCINGSGSGVNFHNIPCDKARRKLRFIAVLTC